MEVVLEVYTQPYGPERFQVCMDETSKQLLGDVQEPLSIQPGQPQRIDYEYEHEGVVDLLMLFEPPAGRRHVKVTDQHARKDWAHAMQTLSDEIYPFVE